MKVEPVRDIQIIACIKNNLSSSPRDACLFTLGINTAFRASDLLSITIGMVRDLEAGDSFEVIERKTKKRRRVTLNATSVNSIQQLIVTMPNIDSGCRLFQGQRGPLTVRYLHYLVKQWCLDAGAPELNYGSHTLRKTWGYHQRVTFSTDIPTLMRAFNHKTQAQTLDYLGIQEHEIASAYLNEL